MKNTKKLIGGLIAGAAIGVAIGVLLAPSSGAKTRRKLLGGSLKMKDDVMASIDDSLAVLRKQFNHKIDQLARGSKDAINHASEKVKM
ncbi:YtxH domain-containing protein [Chryseolinea sp. T2]|uniref:YtxH domain-containing protein n=1 Tax=Chryseolinea sp. T2 TaxID=3129255 RepID=UPI003078941D